MKVNFNKKLMYSALVIYAILLIWVIIFKWTNYEAAEHCIITFRHLGLKDRYDACYKWFFTYDLIDIILNIILFIPLGLHFVLLLNKKSLILLIALLLTSIFEISQFFTCIGMFNLFDLLGNMIGCIIGYIMFMFLKKYIFKKLIDITNVVIITVFLPVCFYAVIMTIINFGYYL